MGLNESQKKERSEFLEKNLNISECSQKKPYAFISYASDNWETVFKKAIVPLQKQYGLCVYADKAFDKVNDRWIVPMLRNVRGSDLMIAFVSQSYIESYACFLELLTAVNNKKQIVFVSLEQELHLGDTTDQPNVERGVKNEILNQGANIATNTNNSSNDLMRAMKSAYTSISTLLEQDALSKYDISDAFINFFRDAAINRKTINDIKALKDTINSVSCDVFDMSAKYEAKTAQIKETPPEFLPDPTQTEDDIKPVYQSVHESENFVYDKQPEVISDILPNVSKPLDDKKTRNTLEKITIWLHNKKILAALGGICCIAIIIAVIALASPKKADDIIDAMATQSSVTHLEEKTQDDLAEEDKYFNESETSEKNDVPVENAEQTTAAEENAADESEAAKPAATVQPVAITEFDMGDIPSNDSFVTLNKDNEKYFGEYSNGAYNGYGTLKKGSHEYTGWFKDGKNDGKGIYTYYLTDNDDKIYVYEVYTGEWKEGKKNGQGTLTHYRSDGSISDKYAGEWKDDNKNGYATYTTYNLDGSVSSEYNGNYVDNYPTQASHKSFYNNILTRHYEGEFLKLNYNGKGTMKKYSSSTGDLEWEYTGDWKDGKKCGQGTMTYANGDVYKGEWENDKKNGQGTMTYADGGEVTGIWKDDEFYGT